MHHERIRIGTPLSLINDTKLHKTAGFDALFDGYHEFVYIRDFDPWARVNGTWKGALGYLLDDMKWIENFWRPFG